MSITNIAFTGIPVTDVSKAKVFYGELLQEEPIFESPDSQLV